MANFIENLGLGFLMENEEATMKLLKQIAYEGKAIKSYHRGPYINYHIGDAQFILNTKFDDESASLTIDSLDTHSAGNSVWRVKIISDITPEDNKKCSRRLLVEDIETRSMTVINVVNADVLPSFLEGSIITLQMIAFPLEINYHETEEDYINYTEKSNSDRCILGDKAVIPTGFLIKNSPENKNNKELINNTEDDCVIIRGTVTEIYFGELKDIYGNIHNGYIRCIIDTKFGELELLHTYEQVAEDQRDNICVGSTVSGVFILSGDPAIYEYKDGIVKDEANHLSLLRHTVKHGEAERLREVLSDDVVYISNTNGKKYIGPDRVIEQIQYVCDNTKINYFPHIGELAKNDTIKDIHGNLYPEGKQCIILAENVIDNYCSVMLIEMDKSDNISCILVDDSYCEFNIEEYYDDSWTASEDCNEKA